MCHMFDQTLLVSQMEAMGKNKVWRFFFFPLFSKYKVQIEMIPCEMSSQWQTHGYCCDKPLNDRFMAQWLSELQPPWT